MASPNRFQTKFLTISRKSLEWRSLYRQGKLNVTFWRVSSNIAPFVQIMHCLWMFSMLFSYTHKKSIRIKSGERGCHLFIIYYLPFYFDNIQSVQHESYTISYFYICWSKYAFKISPYKKSIEVKSGKCVGHLYTL